VKLSKDPGCCPFKKYKNICYCFVAPQAPSVTTYLAPAKCGQTVDECG